MKTFTLIVITIILNACGASKNITSDVENATSTSSKLLQEQVTAIQYQATSRGLYKMVEANKNTINYQNSRTEKATSKPCSEADWSNVLQKLNTVDVSKLDQIEAPTKAHQYDGAALATLTIIKDNKTYTSTTFDHGNPPKQLEGIVNQLLSFMPEKQ